MYAINHRKLVKEAYCIAFSSNETNLFDILPANELLFPHYKNANVHILGLAGDKDEATGLVLDMIIEMYRKTGDFKVREYFGNE